VPRRTRATLRSDQERIKREAFDGLKAKLAHAFAAPDSSYRLLTAEDVIARNKT
jgi:hypothetical protein